MRDVPQKIGPPSPASTNPDLHSESGEKSEAPSSAISGLPQRYTIKGTKDSRELVCNEAPNIAVQVERGFTVSASAAHKSSPGTIYLDGVAQCEPFMDLERQVYNFDHHEGCVRPFTLSTCEQVLVMILKGMDLRGRDWRVFANEPDLDTVLAVWLLFNHVRVYRKNATDLRLLYALVRLEGTIDAHGLEMTALSALSPNRLEKTTKIIDYLRAEEIELKKNADWEKNDPLEYTALILHKIDKLIYKSDEFDDFKDVKELARVDIGSHRIAVVVEAELGIYELEPYLNRIYGESLAVTVLKKGEGFYTLRRLDPFMPFDLNRIYQQLNSIDPDVNCGKNGSKWGGSADIGGSPRGIPTKLTPLEIADACREAFEKTGFVGKATHFAYALALVGAIVAAAAISRYYLSAFLSVPDPGSQPLLLELDLAFFVSLTLFAAIALAAFSRGRWWRFGIRMPTGWDWWLLLPVIIIVAFARGVYVPQRFSSIPGPGIEATTLYMILTIPIGVELLFRSLAHGMMAKSATIQSCRSRWFFSYPLVAAAVLYAVFVACLMSIQTISQGTFQLKVAAMCFAAALVFGMTAGFVRERSQSVFPAILFHMAALTIFYLANQL